MQIEPVVQPLAAPATRPLLREAGRFLLVSLQLALVLVVIHLFKIEPRLPFFGVMCLAVGGFLVHAWLPARFRLAFFALLSMAAFVLLLGIMAAGTIFGLGGIVLAAPLTVVAYVAVQKLYVRQTLGRRVEVAGEEPAT